MFLFKDLARYLFLKWFLFKYKKTRVVSDYFGEKISGFYSQCGQDSYVYSEFFSLFDENKIPKVFVDIGCNHPTKFSNSYFFEKNLGFSCIAVDPLTTYITRWAETRPNAKLHSVALGAANGNLTLMTPANEQGANDIHSPDMFSTLSEEYSKIRTCDWKEVMIPVITAQELFVSNNIEEVGIVSIDVEGFELEVLKGFDFSKTKIFIAIIENNTNTKFGDDAIRQYMKKSNFTFYARIWGMDDSYINNDVLDLLR